MMPGAFPSVKSTSKNIDRKNAWVLLLNFFRHLLFQLLSSTFSSSLSMATSGEEEAFTQSTSPITDVAGAPLILLDPISGYEEMPLVSLEQAVELLVLILSAIQTHASAAKLRCTKPADELTSGESAAITLYTIQWFPRNKCLYVALNDTLRLSSADREEKLKPWYLYLRLFLNALMRLPLLHLTVFRGVKLDLSGRYTESNTYIWWAFSSWATSSSVLKSNSFLGQTGTRTIFNIQCESARDIRKHSRYPTENEVLLLAATQFQVIGCLDQGDLHIIQLKETPLIPPLLQPVPIVSSKPIPVITPQPSNPVSTSENNRRDRRSGLLVLSLSLLRRMKSDNLSYIKKFDTACCTKIKAIR